jgi:hypothetical protein
MKFTNNIKVFAYYGIEDARYVATDLDCFIIENESN